MSYILDALKKAEQQRQREKVPTLATVHTAPVTPPRQYWPWVAAGVLLVNALVLVWFFFLRPTPTAVVETPPPIATVPPPPTAAVIPAPAPPASTPPAPSVATPSPAPPLPPAASPAPSVATPAPAPVRPAPAETRVTP